MAAYFAQAIIDGRDYSSIFRVSVYKHYQEVTDTILKFEGYVELISVERRN